MVKKRVVEYVEVSPPGDLITLAEAARRSGLSLSGVRALIFDGRVSEYIDESAVFHGRRLVSLSEVEAVMVRRHNAVIQR